MSTAEATRRTTRDGHPALPRLAVNRTDASEMLGVSVDFFDEHIAHELRSVHRGRRRLYSMRELERWLDAEAERDALPRPLRQGWR